MLPRQDVIVYLLLAAAVAGASGSAIHADGGYTVSAFTLLASKISYNPANTRPGVLLVGNAEGNAAWRTAFVAVDFTKNTLLCEVNEFLDADSNMRSTSCARYALTSRNILITTSDACEIENTFIGSEMEWYHFYRTAWRP